MTLLALLLLTLAHLHLRADAHTLRQRVGQLEAALEAHDRRISADETLIDDLDQ